MNEDVDFETLRSNAKAASTLLKAIANENRLLILCQLMGCEHSVTELNQRVPLSQSALSQHLAVLRKDGLVATRKEAQTVYYSLANPSVIQVLEVLYNIYCGSETQPA